MFRIFACWVIAVDHRFALGKPALLSAPSKKSFSSGNSPILAWQALQIDARGAFEKLAFPLGDLVG